MDSTVVFNEIMYHTADDDRLEWVELYNQNAVDMDMSGWTIGGGISYEFPAGTILEGGDYLVIAKNPQAIDVTGDVEARGPFGGNLSNGGEQLELRNATDRLMDAISYGDDAPWPVGADGSGFSLAKIVEDSATADPLNWQVSFVSGGSPGRGNRTLAQPPGTIVDLVTSASESRVLIPTASDATADWTAIDFDATTWDVASNRLGFDTSGFATATLSRHYPFDANTLDATGSGFDGVASGPTFQDNRAAAIGTGQSLHFDGADDVVTIADPTSPKSYTISAWVNADEIRDQSIMVRSFVSPTLLWSHQLRMTSDGFFEAHTFDGTRLTVTGSTAAEPNRWYHVAATAESGGQMHLYVNGVAEGVPVDIGQLREDTTDWLVGSNSGGSFAHFAGHIDDVAILSNALNPSQLAAIAGGTPPADVNGITHLIDSDLIDQMHSVNSTAWVRTEFELPLSEYYDQLELNVQYDDGFVAYLNGKKVAERNAPADPNWSSAATREQDPNEIQVSEAFNLAAFLGELRPGPNVLALHGLNESAADGDFFLTASLTSRTAAPDDLPRVLISEVASADAETFWVELFNPNPDPFALDGFRLATSQEKSHTFGETPPIPPGGYLAFDETQLGFTADDNDRLFLLTPFDATLSDAVTVQKRTRGLDDRGLLQYPSAPTPGQANQFDFETDIVINEIMYHARPTYEQPPSEPEDVRTTLVGSASQSWRYRERHPGLDSGWANSEHADDGSEWQTGQAPLGYHADLLDELNTLLKLPFLNNPPIETYYFETEFIFAGRDDAFELLLSHTIDDGAVFYLNGEEVYRYNMADGPVDATVSAEQEISVPLVSEEVSLSLDSLQVGTNRLSVELHQFSALDTDFYLDAQLVISDQVSEPSEYAESTEEWIELYNRGESPIDISGWQLQDAVEYEFAAGTTIGAGEFLVIASNPSDLAQRHELPTAQVLGPFAGSLSNDSERIQLMDQNDNLADQVEYFDNGRWSNYADGAGSSLELRDARADNSVAESWAASVESTRSTWEHFEYTRTVERFPYDPPISFNEFIFGLLDSGEVLIDNVSVVEDPGGEAVQLIQNGAFEADTLGAHADKWRLIGNHRESHVTRDPTNANNQVLQLVAQSKAHYLSNHAETTLVDNTRVRNGDTYQISFDAKWVAGSPQLHSELYHKDAARTTILTQPTISGTPGRPNSTVANNLGPSYEELSHHPVIPKSTDAVTISVRAEDLDGVASVSLLYSIDDGEFQRAAMSATAGMYEATIPALASRSVVQFYVEGTDGLGAVSTFPAAGPESRALYQVDDRFERDELRHDIVVIMTDSDLSELQTVTSMMDNFRYGSTVIYDASEVFYDVGTRYKGSMFTRNSRSTVGYNLRFDPQQKFRGVHETISFDQKNEKEIQVKHLVVQAGLMGAMYDDVTDFQPPGANRGLPTLTTMAGQRNLYLDSQFENGSDGTMFKLEGIRVMQQTVDRNPESLKIYQPIGWVQAFDVRDLGDNKELYRWPILILNNRARDDYDPIIAMAKTFELNGSELESAVTDVIDVDQWMQTLAMMSVTGIADVYGQAEENPHNLNFYVHPESNKVLAFPWDWDFSFQIATNAPLTGRGKAIHKVVRIPSYERLFYGHLLHIIDTVGNSDYMNRWSSHFGSLLRESFGSTGSYLDRRGDSIRSQINSDFASVEFGITTEGPLTTDSAQVTLEGKGWVNIRKIVVDGEQQPLDVQWLDSGGNDADTWQATIPVAPGAQTITLQAFDYTDALIGSQSIEVNSTITSRPLVESLRISELNYNPHDPLVAFGELDTDPDNFEFVELINIGNDSINLAGARFVQVDVDGNQEGIRFQFAEQILGPQERVLVVKDRAAFQSRYGDTALIAKGADGEGNEGEFGGQLSNGGERLTLLDSSGAKILQFAYDDSAAWPQRADGNASSLTILQADGDYADPQNWRASTAFGGSPGTGPLDAGSDIVINEILSATVAPAIDQIELFNTTNQPIDIRNWYLSDGDNNYFKYQVLGEATVLTANGYLVLDQRQLGFGFDGDTADDAWLIAADASGRPIRFADHARFGVAANEVALGRWPNGTGPFVAMSENTFGSANAPPQSSEGDFNADGTIDAVDIGLLCEAINANQPEQQFDLNANNVIDIEDLFVLIEDRLGSGVGDANLDGVFNSQDFVSVFRAGTYEDDVNGNSTWETGDWNCDGDFNTRDLVLAFQRGSYVSEAAAESPTRAAGRSTQNLASALSFHVVRSSESDVTPVHASAPNDAPNAWSLEPLPLPLAARDRVFALDPDSYEVTKRSSVSLEPILDLLASDADTP